MNIRIVAVLVCVLSGCMSYTEKNRNLLWYSAKGDSVRVAKMVAGGADVNTRNKYGDTPLVLAARYGHPSVARFLIQHKADVKVRGALDDTPLHLAAYAGETGLFRQLLARGADSTVVNSFGVRPAGMADVARTEAIVCRASACLDRSGSWTDRDRGRELYDELSNHDASRVVNALAFAMLRNAATRVQVLILAIKLGMPGTEEGLSELLMVYGDKPMAEDYLNSGSSALDTAGRRWASEHGYSVSRGAGSHRAAWKTF